MDACGVSLDAVDRAMRRMRAAAAQIEVPGGKTPDVVRSALFGDAWSIVDQAHMLRSLLHELSTEINVPAFREFAAVSEAATTLRNKMNHLHNNIANLAAKKGGQPLHGALSFCVHRLSEAGERKVASGAGIDQPSDLAPSYIVTLTLGPMLQKNHTFWPANPAGRKIEFPIGCFQLHAFDIVLDLSAIARAAKQVFQAFETDVAKACMELIQSAAKNEEEAKKLLAPQATGITLVMTIQYAEGGADPDIGASPQEPST